VLPNSICIAGPIVPSRDYKRESDRRLVVRVLSIDTTVVRRLFFFFNGIGYGIGIGPYRYGTGTALALGWFRTGTVSKQRMSSVFGG